MPPDLTDQNVILDPKEIDAVIFDMDGVLTDTARTHEAAWARTFDAFLASRGEALRPFSRDDYLKHVDGKPRLDGVRDFLASRGIELPEGCPTNPQDLATVHGLGSRKNAAFRAVLVGEGIDAYADTIDFLDRLAAAGIRVAAIY
jgi:beta-phosphoglucomutase-like phosphatase (HAD superfamily)